MGGGVRRTPLATGLPVADPLLSPSILPSSMPLPLFFTFFGKRCVGRGEVTHDEFSVVKNYGKIVQTHFLSMCIDSVTILLNS